MPRILFVYNPPGNEPIVDILENSLNEGMIIMGDLNSPSTRWGYKKTSIIGAII